MRRWLWLCVFGLAIGCGASGVGDDDDDDVVLPDGGPPACDMGASVSPTAPRAPATIVVTGAIDKRGLFGLESFSWAVDRNGTPVETTPRDPAASEIEFEAPTAGPYRIIVSGDVGGSSCAQYSTTVNVTDPAANDETYRLALVPRADQPAPPQLQLVTIAGGADFDIGPRNLGSGLAVSGTLRAPGGAATAGYLRAVATAEPVLAIPRETFAGVDGSFQLRLLPGAYDVLVVADGTGIAPAMLLGIEAAALSGVLDVPTADTLSGTVVRADDSPVSGARVALTIDGVPSTIGITDGVGAFTVLAHAGGATALTVVPADTSLPQLDVPASAGWVAAPETSLAIRYGAGTAARAESFTLVASDGATAVPGASVTFIARPVVAAGTLTPAAGTPMDADATARVTATADGAGAVGPLSLPPAVYDVVVGPPAGSAGADVASLAVVDLMSAAPALSSLSLAAPAHVGVSAPLAPLGTRVTAVPRGMLARAAAATVETATAALGRIDLDLVGAGEYDVTIHTPAGYGRAPVLFAVTAPAAGAVLELDPIALPDAIAITGSVQSPDIAGGVSGVTVLLLCGDCTGAAATVPIAKTVSGSGGAFTLLVPDPGTSE